MGHIRVNGGVPLVGETAIQGSKNAALPMIAASVLNRGTTVLHNCPQIADVAYMARILESIGCHTKWEGHTLIIDARGVSACEIRQEYGSKMRSSVILAGSLLGRMGRVDIAYPGGCVIGERPINLHLAAMRQMNVDIEDLGDHLSCASSRLVGADIHLAFPSVGATENTLLAAVTAAGETTISNAAREPEITQLCGLLAGMGAKIEGAGTDTIRICGVGQLHDVEYQVPGDRIVAGTYLLACAGTRGHVTLLEAPAEHLAFPLEMFEKMGGRYALYQEGIVLDGRGAGKPLPLVETAPYPGFPTDLQSQLVAVQSLAEGDSLIRENIFEDRFHTARELKKMGANLRIDGREVSVRGVGSLWGAKVHAGDLRGGAALVTAGLMAAGTTIVKGVELIDRGYEDICQDLGDLGADIYRELGKPEADVWRDLGKPDVGLCRNLKNPDILAADICSEIGTFVTDICGDPGKPGLDVCWEQGVSLADICRENRQETVLGRQMAGIGKQCLQ